MKKRIAEKRFTAFLSESDHGSIEQQKNEKEISSAIIKSLTNPELAKRLGEQGRERVLKDFQWPQQAQKIIKILS